MDISKVDAIDALFLSERKRTCPTVPTEQVLTTYQFLALDSANKNQNNFMDSSYPTVYNFMDSEIEFDSMMNSYDDIKIVQCKELPEVVELFTNDEIRKSVRGIKDDCLREVKADHL